MKIPKFTIILFYKFTNINNPEKVRDAQRKLCESFNLKGRMFVATEGINATFEGKTKDVNAYIRAFKKQSKFKDVVFKKSAGFGQAFTKLKVKVRPEVVTMEAGKFNVVKETAPAITATELEKLYKKNDDFVILDLRNDFEVQAGSFERTVNPQLQNFRDLPGKIRELKPLKNKKVITVCTGGIRCEKATCLLKKKGFKNLYQLKDGIHTYIQKYPGQRFKGSLFVFDNRMTTPVVSTKNRRVISTCAYCQTSCEEFYNDDSVRPSRKVICCNRCIKKHPELRHCNDRVIA